MSKSTLSEEEKKEKNASASRRWARAHREQVRDYQRKYRESHPGKAAEATRKWRESHPDRYRATAKRQKIRSKKARLQRKGSMLVRLARCKRGYGASIRNAVLHHHGKGRSIADIVLWTGVPSSVVLRIVEEFGGHNE